MRGIDYVAVQRIYNKVGTVMADVGETCERVAEVSLSWLEEKGAIRHVSEHTATARERGLAEMAALEAAAEKDLAAGAETAEAVEGEEE